MAGRDFLGSFELMVLLALIHESAAERDGGPAYGVPIARAIEKSTGREVVLGSVYAALDRLEEKGLVSSWIGDPTPERGGRAKRHFRITAKGLRSVRQTRQALTRLWRGIPALGAT